MRAVNVNTICSRYKASCKFSVNAREYFLNLLPSDVAIVDSSAHADLVIVFDSHDGDTIEELDRRELFHPKTVMYSQAPDPVVVIPGLYVNLNHRRLSSRARTCGYISYLAETGGNPLCRGVEERAKEFLFCFAGRNCYPVRERIFRKYRNSPDYFVRDTSEAYDHWGDDRNLSAQESYVETIRRSHFSVCPRGIGTNSIRLFESMRLGVAPIVISDTWPYPDGPSWDNFCLRIAESEIDHLDQILQQHKHRSGEMGRLARQAYEDHFSVKRMPESILRQLSGMVRPTMTENVCRSTGLVRHYSRKTYWRGYRFALSLRDCMRGLLRQSTP